MKMVMKIMQIAFCLLFIAAVSGCKSPVPQMQPKNSGQVLYTVTDATGTELKFYEKPQRIVSLNVSVDEILLDLVDSKRIAALSAMADDANLCNAAAKAKVVQGRVNTTNIEDILAMQPDLVVIPDYSMTPVNAMRNAGLKVYVCRTPDSLQGIYSFMESIGSAVGEPERGKAMTNGMQERLDAIRNKVLANVPENKRLKVLGMSFMGPMGMKGTFNDVCYYGGVRNALDGVDVPPQSTLSEEKMLELDPDMIITPSWDYSKEGDPEKFRQKILNNPLYKNIKAIKTGKVVMLHDNYLLCTSQYTVKAAEEMAQAAYPELFK